MVRLPTSSWREATLQVDRPEEKQFNALPHFSTLHKHYTRILMNELVRRSSDQLLDVDLSKAGARATRTNNSESPQCRVRAIMPSEYARADVFTPPVWEQLKSTSLAAQRQRGSSAPVRTPSISSTECVDIWPIVAARKWFYGPQSALHLHCDEGSRSSTNLAEALDVIKATLLNPPETFSERFERCFVRPGPASPYVTVQGCILHTWDGSSF